MSKITEYFNETKAELKQVSWPTKSQTIVFSVIVIILSVATAYLLGFFDFLFSQGVQKIIQQ